MEKYFGLAEQVQIKTIQNTSKRDDTQHFIHQYGTISTHFVSISSSLLPGRRRLIRK